MAKDVTMPLLSPSMTEGTVVRWLKKEGDAVKSGDTLAEVETDKAVMELQAFDSGVLRKILVPEGGKALINARIAIIGTKDEAIDEKAAASAPPPAAKDDQKPIPASTPEPAMAAAVHGEDRVKASPLAKKIALERGVPLAQLSGSGPGGRIVKRDVLLPVDGKELGSGWGLHGPGPVNKGEKLALSNMRQTIARRLLESKTQIPHFYLQIEIDAEPLTELRATLNAGFAKLPKPFKLTLNDFILKACAEGIRRVPTLNASFEGDAIQQYANVNLSFAVTVPDGLITPVIREAQNKSLKQISDEARTLAARARDGKLKPDEYLGGTFTVSNLGMMNVDSFSAIINPPQAAILAVGSMVKKPVIDAHDAIVVGHRITLNLSCDHRVVDGSVGAKFLQELRELLEKPSFLLL